MKKFLLSVFTVSAIAGSAFGNVLAPDEALSRVYNSNGPLKLASNSPIELKITHFENGSPAIYLFSKGADKGFLAVSANDNSIPLLGYTDSGTLTDNFDDLPDGLRYWLQSLGEQISKNTGKYIPPRKATSKAAISPMTSTKWNQDAPYNDKCPEINGTRCVTGCVATAMAQVLKYYSYPVTGTGTYSYSWKSGGKDLSFDYGATTFDWDNMTDTYDSNSTSAQKDAVATLMYACGVGVEMDYTTSSSGAVSYYMVRALTDNFGYAPSVQYLMRDYYSLSEWEDIIYDNLEYYGPVLYGGVSNQGGHEFVCDGYDNGYFHFNWGWGGMSDGYFVLTALDPESQGIGGSASGYNFQQDIVIHLEKAEESSGMFAQMLWDGAFTIDEPSATLGSDLPMTWSFYNYSSGTLKDVRFGLEFVPSTGGKTIFAPVNTYFSELPMLSGLNSRTLDITIPANLGNGTYTVRPAFYYDNDSSTLTPIKTSISYIGSYTAVVNGNTVSFTADEPATVLADNFSLESQLYVNNDFKLTATLTNTSDNKEYYGEIIPLILGSNNSLIAEGDPVQIDLAAGESTNLEYIGTLTLANSTNIQSGQSCTLYLCTVDADGNATPISEPLSATIYEANSPTLSASNLHVTNTTGTQISATADVMCESGYFGGSVRLFIFPSSGGTSLAYCQSPFFAVSANPQGNVSQTASVSFDYNFTSAEPGTEYAAAIFYNSTQISDGAYFTMGEYSGIDSLYSGNGDDTSDVYFTINGVQVGERPTQPGIYIVRHTHSDGTVTTSKVLIN